MYVFLCKFELSYFQILFSDFFFESFIDIQWITSTFLRKYCLSHFYECLDVFLNVLAIFNESHSQNTVLTRFVLRTIKRNLEKTNRIRRDINRNMCENTTTLNCNPVLHSKVENQGTTRSNWFVPNTRNRDRTILFARAIRKYLFSLRDRIVTTSRMDYRDFSSFNYDWHHLRRRCRDNGRAIGIVSHTRLPLCIIYAWAAIIFGEMPWIVLPYPSGILQWILDPLGHRAPSKGLAEAFCGATIGSRKLEENLIFILLWFLIKNIESKVSWNCIDDGNRTFYSISL